MSKEPKPPLTISGDLDAVRPSLKGPLTGGDMPPPTDAEVTANAQQIGQAHNAFTTLPPPPSETTSWTLKIPKYLDEELKIKAVKTGSTKAFLLLQALKAAGFRVDDADMIPDRRKVR